MAPLVREYRLYLPMSVAQYRVAQLYMVAKMSEEETIKTKGEGVKVLINEPRPIPFGRYKGTASVYTEKNYYIRSRLPSLAQKIAPALIVVEAAYNAFPYCWTQYSCKALGDNFITIESLHVDKDYGEQENALNLDKETLKLREIVPLDIYNDPAKTEHHPGKFESKNEKYKSQLEFEKTKGWIKKSPKAMTVYKNVIANAQLNWSLGWLTGTTNGIIHNSGPRAQILDGHRRMLCWFDEWIHMDMAAVRVFEAETEARLAKLFAKPNTEDNGEGKTEEGPPAEPTTETSSSSTEITTETSVSKPLDSKEPLPEPQPN